MDLDRAHDRLIFEYKNFSARVLQAMSAWTINYDEGMPGGTKRIARFGSRAKILI